MTSIGPQIPAHLLESPPQDVEHDSDSGQEDAYLPALPPDLLAAPSVSKGLPVTKGPTLPPPAVQNDEDSDDEVGPMPLPAGSSLEREDAVKEFMEIEERRRKLAEVCPHCKRYY
jgi:hypothetical protein